MSSYDAVKSESARADAFLPNRAEATSAPAARVVARFFCMAVLRSSSSSSSASRSSLLPHLHDLTPYPGLRRGVAVIILPPPVLHAVVRVEHLAEAAAPPKRLVRRVGVAAMVMELVC